MEEKPRSGRKYLAVGSQGRDTTGKTFVLKISFLEGRKKFMPKTLLEKHIAYCANVYNILFKAV